MAPPLSPSHRLDSIDVLRGLAALAVVAIHIPHYAHGGWREHPFFFLAFLFNYGYLGVPLFVVISGFCIHRRAALKTAKFGTSKIDWIGFWKRRFWRLYPPYLAAIVFSLSCAYFLHDRFEMSWPDLAWNLSVHLLLVQNLTKEYATSLGNGAFWTLGMEEQLYMLYFLLFLVMVRCSRRTALAFVVVITVAWQVATFWLRHIDIQLGGIVLGSWGQWPFIYWLHWTLGALAVDAYCGNVRLPRWCFSVWWAAGLSLVGVVLNQNMINLVSSLRFVQTSAFCDGFEQTILPIWTLALPAGIWSFAMSFFCLMNWSLGRELRGAFTGQFAGRLAAVGRMSYSLYLTHVPVIYVLEEWVPFGHSPRDWLLRYLIYAPTTLLVGYAFFWSVESWFLTRSTSRQQACSESDMTKTQPAQA